MFCFRRAVTATGTAVAAALLAVAGCGGDDSSPAAGDQSSAPTTTAVTVPAPEGIPGVVLERAPGRVHTNADVDYPGAKPPSGGDHDPVPAPCGFYDKQVRDENGVHSLEHSAVWIAFAPPPATSDADIATIKNLVNSHAKVLASPYEGLNKPLVLVAWERRLELDTINDPRVAQFMPVPEPRLSPMPAAKGSPQNNLGRFAAQGRRWRCPPPRKGPHPFFVVVRASDAPDSAQRANMSCGEP